MTVSTNAVVEQWLRMATAAESRGEATAALTAWRRLLALDPAHPGALLRLGQAALRDGAHAAGVAQLRQAAVSARARGFAPQTLPIHRALLLALRGGDPRERLAATREAQADCGELPGLIWEECECLYALGETYPRLLRLNRLAALQPSDPVILEALGLALANYAPLAHQALKPLRDAIALGANSREVRTALATIEIFQGELDAAEPRLLALVEQDDRDLGTLGKLWALKRAQCGWREAEQYEITMLALIDQGEQSAWLTPFMLLDSAIAPQALRDYAKRSASRVRGAAPVTRRQAVASSQPPRLRIGYLSGDLHTHAVACHLVGLIEAHDHARVETFAYSCGARVDRDPYRLRLQRAFEHWRDLNEINDAAAAQIIADDAIDVLFDLSGPTHGSRSGILAHRPASRVIHYLGYPGTIATGAVDYLLADETVIPRAHDSHYVEKVLRMPQCYQVNDPRRERPPPPPRAEVGLPQDAIVLCNFNRPAKWTAPFMRIWCRALQQAPHAVLWLATPDHAASREAVGVLAAEFGVAERILWAPKRPMTEHLARHGCADLALDQLPYASHATGANALWMGVPLLTCVGDMFQGRVGASLAKAAALDDFVTETLAEYEARLHWLLKNPARLASAKQHLLTKADELPLFDAARFTRELEAALSTMVAADAASRRASMLTATTIEPPPP